MAGTDFREIRATVGEAQRRIPDPVARAEGAADGRADQARWQAGDRVERLAFWMRCGDRFEQAAGVGVPGILEKVVFGGAFDDSSGVHHVDVVTHFRHHREIVSNEYDGGAEGFLAIADEIEHLLLNGDVKSGGGLVADQELRPGDEGHGDHDALAHTAGELVRVAVDTFFRFVNADFGKGLDGAVERGFSRDAFVDLQWFGQLAADLHEGVQRGHRVLEDHRDPLAPDLAELLFRGAEEVDAVEHRGARVDAAGRLGDQAEQGVTGHRFPGAGLTDDPKRLPGLDRKGHIIDRMDNAVAGVEAGGEVLDVEERHR